MEDYFEFDSREAFEELAELLRECECERDILRRCCEAYQWKAEEQQKRLEAAQAEAELWHNRFGEAVAQQAKIAENGARLAGLLEKAIEKAMMKGGGDE